MRNIPQLMLPLFYCLVPQFQQSGCLNWYCLHTYLLQPPHHLLYLLMQILFWGYDGAMYLCFVLSVMSLSVFVTWMVYEHSLWSLSRGSTIISFIHSSPVFLQNYYCSCKKERMIFLSIIVLKCFSDRHLGPHNMCHHCLKLQVPFHFR